ncbi:hypothetical protein OCU04_008196 [Sclerotinia nivalis]|uniref:2EXR domain-containing protein n=1 Tax=Sclerotinia nivalis TaxID=352851 RepID=A0A9X0AIH4_9HELO|nr:hypothetical protein OCU04_008196 [Sclerotinia nivalis]
MPICASSRDMPVNDTKNKMDSDSHRIVQGTSRYRKKLPTELWTEIWKIVTNDNPRNLDIWALGVDAAQWEPFRFITTQIVPPILHVSVLSRNIGLKYYKLSFGLSIPTPVGESKIEPRIYRHIHNDCICPMGLFDKNSTTRFWEALREEGAAAIAINICSLSSRAKGSEEDGNKIGRGEFEDENWGDIDRYIQTFHTLILTCDPWRLVRETLEKVSKVYLYSFGDYFDKRSPIDFRFTPFSEKPNHRIDYFRARRQIESSVKDPDDRTTVLLRWARMSLPWTRAEVYLHAKWVQWLDCGGLNWFTSGVPKPCGIQDINSTGYDWERNKFFEMLQPWEEERFLKRGDPRTETAASEESFSGPGIPEVRFMKLEIHGWVRFCLVSDLVRKAACA